MAIVLVLILIGYLYLTQEPSYSLSTKETFATRTTSKTITLPVSDRLTSIFLGKDEDILYVNHLWQGRIYKLNLNGTSTVLTSANRLISNTSMPLPTSLMGGGDFQHGYGTKKKATDYLFISNWYFGGITKFETPSTMTNTAISSTNTKQYFHQVNNIITWNNSAYGAENQRPYQKFALQKSVMMWACAAVYIDEDDPNGEFLYTLDAAKGSVRTTRNAVRIKKIKVGGLRSTWNQPGGTAPVINVKPKPSSQPLDTCTTEAMTDCKVSDWTGNSTTFNNENDSTVEILNDAELTFSSGGVEVTVKGGTNHLNAGDFVNIRGYRFNNVFYLFLFASAGGSQTPSQATISVLNTSTLVWRHYLLKSSGTIPTDSTVRNLIFCDMDIATNGSMWLLAYLGQRVCVFKLRNSEVLGMTTGTFPADLLAPTSSTAPTLMRDTYHDIWTSNTGPSGVVYPRICVTKREEVCIAYANNNSSVLTILNNPFTGSAGRPPVVPDPVNCGLETTSSPCTSFTEYATTDKPTRHTYGDLHPDLVTGQRDCALDADCNGVVNWSGNQVIKYRNSGPATSNNLNSRRKDSDKIPCGSGIIASKQKIITPAAGDGDPCPSTFPITSTACTTNVVSGTNADQICKNPSTDTTVVKCTYTQETGSFPTVETTLYVTLASAQAAADIRQDVTGIVLATNNLSYSLATGAKTTGTNTIWTKDMSCHACTPVYSPSPCTSSTCGPTTQTLTATSVEAGKRANCPAPSTYTRTSPCFAPVTGACTTTGASGTRAVVNCGPWGGISTVTGTIWRHYAGNRYIYFNTLQEVESWLNSNPTNANTQMYFTNWQNITVSNVTISSGFSQTAASGKFAALITQSPYPNTPPNAIGTVTINIQHDVTSGVSYATRACPAATQVASCGYNNAQAGNATGGTFVGWNLADAQWACDEDRNCKGVYFKSESEGYFKITTDLTAGTSAISKRNENCYSCGAGPAIPAPCTSPSPSPKCGPGTRQLTYTTTNNGPRAPANCPLAPSYNRSETCLNPVSGTGADASCTAAGTTADGVLCGTRWGDAYYFNQDPTGLGTRPSVYRTYKEAQKAVEELMVISRATNYRPTYIINPRPEGYVIRQVDYSRTGTAPATAENVGSFPGWNCYTNTIPATATTCVANNGICGPGTRTINYTCPTMGPRQLPCPAPLTNQACPAPACPDLTGTAFRQTAEVTPYGSTGAYKAQCTP